MEDIRDYEILNCKHCGQSKKRIRAGKRPQSKETKFVGEDGLEWNGHVCSVCVVEKARLRKQLNKKLKDEDKRLAKFLKIALEQALELEKKK